MAEVVFLLRLEHHKMARLLDAFELLIAGAAAGASLDDDLARSIAGYFAAYPGRCHHPKEDLVYRKMCERDAVAARAVGVMVDEHEQLGRRAAELTALLSDGLAGETTNTPRLLTAAATYIAASRRHMAFEETYFLPAAIRLLTADDWAEIEFAVFDHADPIFSETVERRFEALRRDLLGARQ